MMGNISVIEVFLAGRGQVRMSPSGQLIGLDYQAVRILMEAWRVKNTRFFWEKFRILEKEWLRNRD